MKRAADIVAWVDRVADGDRRALARALTEVENRGPARDSLLAELFERAKPAWRIGVTGAPGSGKSTLVNALAARLEAQGRRVAVLAVDPSSPFTGGAVLGDRVRMSERDSGSNVFIRSLATRGALGGLASAAGDLVTVLEAAGRDVIVIETVGVGQAEVDVVGLAETVALVLTPNMGDDVQAVKAGVMEIADVFVLNKCDLPGADRAEKQIEAALSLRPSAEGTPPVVRTVAEQGEGIDALLSSLEERRGGEQAQVRYRRERIEAELTTALRRVLGPRLAPAERIEEAAAGLENPYEFVARALEPLAEDRPRIDHLGVAVRSIDEALRAYRAFGFAVEERKRVEHEQVETAMLPAGEARIELLEPTAEDSAVGRFLAKRGEGLHHVAVRVPDLDRAANSARKQGLRLVQEEPQVGAGNYRYLFVHPKSAGGVLLELIEDFEPSGSADGL